MRDPTSDPRVGDVLHHRGRLEVTEVWVSATGATCLLGTRDGEPRGWTLESWRAVTGGSRARGGPAKAG